jgi:hypothetical protein
LILSRRTLGVTASLLLLAHPGTAAQALDSPLEFLGFRVGAPLAELDARLRELGGSRLRCDQAKADRRVRECRAVLSDSASGGVVSLWVSAVDSAAAILTLSGTVESDQLDRWRSHIQTRYGRVGAQVQGSQWMMQWVRSGRMLRLTWRVENNQKVVSVSLVDGHILDAWGRSRRNPVP